MDPSLKDCTTCKHHHGKTSIDDVPDRCYPCVHREAALGYYPNWERMEHEEDAGWQGYDKIVYMKQEDREYTGGSVNYYRVKVSNPTSGCDAYTAECNDIIEALGMNYAQGNIFKAVWRMCAAENLGLSKEGYKDGLYDSEKIAFFGEREVNRNKYKGTK